MFKNNKNLPLHTTTVTTLTDIVIMLLFLLLRCCFYFILLLLLSWSIVEKSVYILLFWRRPPSLLHPCSVWLDEADVPLHREAPSSIHPLYLTNTGRWRSVRWAAAQEHGLQPSTVMDELFLCFFPVLFLFFVPYFSLYPQVVITMTILFSFPTHLFADFGLSDNPPLELNIKKGDEGFKIFM